MIPQRSSEKPIAPSYILLFFVVLTVILAIATGYYHQRWQNQLKRSARLQKQLDVMTASPAPILKVDPNGPTK